MSSLDHSWVYINEVMQSGPLDCFRKEVGHKAITWLEGWDLEPAQLPGRWELKIDFSHVAKDITWLQ